VRGERVRAVLVTRIQEHIHLFEELAERLSSRLYVTDSIDTVGHEPIFCIFWNEYPLEQATYQRLSLLCPRIMQFVGIEQIAPSSQHRLGKREDPLCPVMMVPFDPEEVELVIRKRLKWLEQG
jgi:hypothetical protein